MANWAPHGHCYYYKGVGDFMIASGPNGTGHRGKSEMCL